MSNPPSNPPSASPPAPPGLRRVAIDPVSRVEGHGKITLLLDEHHRVQQARLHIVEFRGFEQFICGRPWWEVPVMVQRLCGICPVSHHLAAAKALDLALGARPIPRSAELLRRLMHYGQVMQSHALHFFHLASPDLLFGFDAEPTRRNLVGVAAAHPDIARQGVWLRKFGQEIIRATAGKRIHGTGAVPGGMNKHLSADDLALLRGGADQAVAWSQQAVALVRRLHAANPALYDGFAAFAGHLMSLVRPADGALELYDGVLRVRQADGHLMHDAVPDQDYLSLIEEAVRPWTYMKFPYLRALGPDTGWYKVGPLARVQNCSLIPSPLAEAERQALVAHGRGALVQGTLAFHWARMIEMLHTAEVVRELLRDPALLDGELMTAPDASLTGTGREREGVGIIEAPRGTLIHHYRVGDDDLISQCNLIVSTTHNNQAMNEAVARAADQAFDGSTVSEPMLNAVEVAIRAFDPCLSCATHALGQMPLQVQLLDAQGQLVDQALRSPAGSVVDAG